LKCPVDDVRDTKVQLTLLGGKVVWEQTNAVISVSSGPRMSQQGRMAWPMAAK
jgi:hypothetical protein